MATRIVPIIRETTVRIFMALSAHRDPRPDRRTAVRCPRCLGGCLEQPLLDLLLAGDSVAGPGHRLETLLVQFLAALHADAVGPAPDPRERLVDLLQHLAVSVRQGVEELLRV